MKLPLLQWEEADGSKGSGFISGVKKHEGRGHDGESGAEGEGFALDFVSDIAPPSLSNTPTRTQKTGFNLTNNKGTSKSGWPRQGPITFYWCYSTNNDAPNRDKALEERNAVLKKANTAIKAARETFENAIADQKVPPVREREQEADLRKAEAALREAEADLDYATDLAETAKQQASHTVNLDNIQDVLKGEQLIQDATAAAEAAAKKRDKRDIAQRKFERLQGTTI